MKILKFLPVTLVLIFAAWVAAAQTAGSNPHVADNSIRRGHAHYAAAEYEAAITEYEGVLPGAAAYAQSLYNIGVCYYELWRTEEAITFYRKAITERQGRYPAALYAMGVALEDLKRLSEAESAYREAIAESAGKHAPAHYRLGLLAAYAQDYAGAAKLFRKALALTNDRLPVSGPRPGEQPAWGACHNNLGVVLALSGHLNQAKREFETALSQTQGTLTEAAANLKLCRAQLASPVTRQLASLQLSEATTHIVTGE